MNEKVTINTKCANGASDPLGLRELPPLDSPDDGWPAISAALNAERQSRVRRIAGWATAAALVLTVGLVSWQSGEAPGRLDTDLPQQTATLEPSVASEVSEEALDELVAMSQVLERHIRDLRQDGGPMPAASAVYLAEIQDMVAQVDKELSFSPYSVNLWGQRVNLLLDLAQLYQHQWEREYGRIASL